ncbi:ABC transporter substrate-binding protein [Streptomyces sp. NPDC056716]|uniref:ABC transporter substrate-binding protein n=1 Tax=unclassified Streptomyces TaxID=2593676 RepID=UPI0036B9228A
MSSQFSRRKILGAGAGVGAALGLGGLGASGAQAATASASGAVAEETRSLDALYEAAMAEGGKFVAYFGGDYATMHDGIKNAFLARFPEIDFTVVVDYSKYHDVRVDNQLETDTLVPDLVQFQTLHDFPRWDKEGHLLRYRPAGFSKVHSSLKASNGSSVAVIANAFSFVPNVTTVGADAPRTALELLDPKWKGRLVARYPHDDDAALYLFVRYVERYGWDWAAGFAAQDVQFLRGALPLDVAARGEKDIAVGVGSSPVATATPLRLTIPDGNHPFMAWGQRAAILKQAKNPAAAKLYLNWQLSTARQSVMPWTVRTDVPAQPGLKHVWEYPAADVNGFPEFMADRYLVERWKQTFALYFGEVVGEPTPGWLGLHPGA